MRRTSTSAGQDWLLLAGGAVAALWRWRLELALVAVPALGWRELARSLDPTAAAGLVAVATALVVIPVRRRLGLWLRAARVRRRWRRAWLDVGLSRVTAQRVRQVPAGELVRIRCSRGSSIPTVEAHRE